MKDIRPISQRTDAELVLQVLGTKGRPDPLLVEMARRLERRMAAEEMLVDLPVERWVDLPAALRRQAG